MAGMAGSAGCHLNRATLRGLTGRLLPGGDPRLERERRAQDRVPIATSDLDPADRDRGPAEEVERPRLVRHRRADIQFPAVVGRRLDRHDRTQQDVEVEPGAGQAPKRPNGRQPSLPLDRGDLLGGRQLLLEIGPVALAPASSPSPAHSGRSATSKGVACNNTVAMYGIASRLTWEPNWLIVSPTQRRRKSAWRRSPRRCPIDWAADRRTDTSTSAPGATRVPLRVWSLLVLLASMPFYERVSGGVAQTQPWDDSRRAPRHHG